MSLFGTDGVRGEYGVEITDVLARKLGYYGTQVLTDGHKPTIIIGKDTRESGSALEEALIEGITEAGGSVYLAGVIPTPAMAVLVKQLDADAAVMVSASHNPYKDNGIKFFNKEGYKLDDSIEAEIEKLVLENKDEIKQEGGSATTIKEAPDIYLDFIRKACAHKNLKGYKIVLDCANGSNYKIAPEYFKDTGAEVIVMADSPNGKNINDNCGSTHLKNICKAVVEEEADFGFAFDGDADRCMAIANNGEIINGDRILYLLATKMKEKGLLKGDMVVGTTMTNLGLEEAFEKEGIKVIREDVGDRYVLKCMLDNNYNLGGEQSGHIILLDKQSTGDGLLTASILADIFAESDLSTAELSELVHSYPQVIINAEVENNLKEEYDSFPEVNEAIKKAQDYFADPGRVIIRPSGTQPMVRVMIEGIDLNEVTEAAENIRDLIESRIGQNRG